MAKVSRLEKTYVRLDDAGAPTKERDGTPSGEFAFRFKETGNEFSGSIFQIAGMTKEIWASLPVVVKNLTMHGIMQKCGDPAAGETGEDVEDAVTSLCEMILAGNFYAERTKGESRPSMLAEAVWQFKASQGQIVTGPDGIERAAKKDGAAETFADLLQRYAGKDGAENRKLALGNSKVRAILADLKEAAAKARREAAAKKAAETTDKTTAEDL